MQGLVIAPGLDSFLSEFTIKKTQPDFVAFLATSETVTLVSEIIKNQSITSYKIFLIKNMFSTAETIHEFLHAFHWLKEKGATNITIDATNCLTVIEMATYVSASLIDLFREVMDEKTTFRPVYVHTEYEMKEDGVAGEVRGTEKLVDLEKPVDSLSFVLAFDATRAFNRGRYAQAYQDFHILANQTTGEKSMLYLGLSHLSKAYELWDSMHTAEAEEMVTKALASLGRVQANPIKELIPKIEENKKGLQKLLKEDSVHTIFDLYANALRREGEMRYDDATARLYACMERITQHQLQESGIITKHPEYDKLPKDVVAAFEKELGSLPIELELKKNVRLLMLLHDPLEKTIEQVKYTTFLGLLEIRNSSILAHGKKPVTKEKYTSFKEKLVLPFLTTFKETIHSEEDVLKQHTHLKIPSISEMLLVSG